MKKFSFACFLEVNSKCIQWHGKWYERGSLIGSFLEKYFSLWGREIHPWPRPVQHLHDMATASLSTLSIPSSSFCVMFWPVCVGFRFHILHLVSTAGPWHSFVPGLPRSLMAGSFSLFRAPVKNISPESPSDTYLSPVSQTCSLVTVHSTALLVSFITWLSLERKWQEGRHRGCLFIAACPAPE